MPAAVAAGIAKTALVAPTVGAGIGAGAGVALGTGLAAGSALAGGAGIFSNFMAGAAPGLGGTLGGVAPAVATKIAPAATSQLMGTIGGNVAPGAFGANLAGAGQGLASALPGATSGLTSALPGVTSTLPGAYNPAMAQNLGAQFLKNAPPLAKPFGAETLLADTSTKIAPNVIQQTATTSPYDLSAGFKQGLDPRVLQQPSLSNPTVSPLSTTQAANPADIVGRSIRPDQNFLQNLGNIGSFQDVKDYAEQHPYATSAAVGLGTMGISKLMQQKKVPPPEDNAMIRPYTYERTQRPEAYATSPTMDSSERDYFNDQFIAGEPYKATEKAEGGIASAYAVGGPVEQMAAMNSVGANTGYPMADMQTPMYANPMIQRPEATNVIAPSADAGVGAYSGEQRFASGGISHLGDYSDGGRLLKGPGDGVSDSIPASIGGRQPARLADGEFVIPARIVSELGNGSTEAGARKLYAMMERVQNARKKSIGKKKVAVNSKADKHLPA